MIVWLFLWHKSSGLPVYQSWNHQTHVHFVLKHFSGSKHAQSRFGIFKSDSDLLHNHYSIYASKYNENHFLHLIRQWSCIFKYENRDENVMFKVHFKLSEHKISNWSDPWIHLLNHQNEKKFTVRSIRKKGKLVSNCDSSFQWEPAWPVLLKLNRTFKSKWWCYIKLECSGIS